MRVCITDGTNKRKKSREEKKRSFRVFVCQNHRFTPGDLHVSSIDGGRGAPEGCMFQIEEKKKKKIRHFAVFPSGI